MQTRKSHIVVSALAVLGLVLASCAPAAAPVAPPRASTPAPAKAPSASVPPATTTTPKPALDQPRYGGIVTRALARDVASFDLQREQGSDASQTIFNVYQGLVRLDPIGHREIIPELAEKWDISPEGNVYTFTFYKGIKWHDGRPFTMQDVKYSLDRMKDPKAFKTVSPRGESLLAAMDKAEMVGEDTIRVTTKYPSASFLFNLASGWIAIEPKHILEAKGDIRNDCVGTGPFKLKEFNPNISLELAKNQDYHIKGMPYLDGIQAELILLDPTTLYERAERKAFDLICMSWADTTGDPDETLFAYYGTGGSRNYGDFSSKEIDDLIEKQARTMDRKGREAILAEIERKCIDQVPMVICFWNFSQVGAWREVKNFSLGSGIHAWGKLDQIWLAQ